MRIVLDTNVLISAFAFPGGPPEFVYRLAIHGEAKLLTSRALLTEFGRVLGEKLEWEPRLAEAAVAHVLGIAEVIEPTESIDVIIADPTDNRVLEVAVAGQADAVVSGDHHLLDLKIFRGIPIQTPTEFLDRQTE